MKTLKLLTLTTLATLTVSIGHAQLRCAQVYKAHTTTTQIQNDFIQKNNFRTDRTLDTYSAHFPFKTTDSLQKTVEQLPNDSVWVDMGAGEARALIDGLKSNPRISLGVGIAYKKPVFALDGAEVSGRFRYVDGDFVENMVQKGQLDHLKNRVDLITDVFGPFSYSEHLPPLLQSYLDLLRPNGVAVFNLMSERNFQNTGNGPQVVDVPIPLNPVLVQGRKNQAGILAWLRSIPGIEVVEVGEYTGTAPGLWEKSFAIKIRKLSSNVVVPQTLKTVTYEASSPPIRTFESVSTQNYLPRAAGQKEDHPARHLIPLTLREETPGMAQNAE